MQKTVLVVGTSTGIGRNCALDLAQCGWKVLASVRNPNDAPCHEQITEILLDVTEDCLSLGELELDAVVYNSGIVVAGPLELIPESTFNHQLDVNLLGAMRVVRATMPTLRQHRGRMVFVGSISGRVATPLTGAYNISKFGLAGLSDALRREVRNQGVQVACIEPGAVDTPIWDKSRHAAAEVFATTNFGPYTAGMGKIKRESAAAAKRAIAPHHVSRAIRRALTARRCKARYLVGVDARIGAFMQRFCPTLLDRLL
jgi:NAD(P)-dependent dehydrogenase (short-subunit alcohol dehydrogenase family)